ncbi:hypothetical protein GCM10009566_60390 [Streptomyces murinus]
MDVVLDMGGVREGGADAGGGRQPRRSVAGRRRPDGLGHRCGAGRGDLAGRALSSIVTWYRAMQIRLA